MFRMELLGAEVRPVTSGSRTLKDAVNEALRDWVASVGEHPLLPGIGDGPPPVSVDGPGVPAGHRGRGPASSAGRSWTGSIPTWWWPAPAVAPTRPASSPGSPTPPASALVAVEAEGGAAMTDRHPRGAPRHAAAPSCRARRARSSRPTPSRPGWTIRGSARSTPISANWAGPATSRPATTRSSTPSSVWPGPRASSRPSSRPTPWPGCIARGRDRVSFRTGSTVLVNLSGRGDKDVAQVRDMLRP